MPLYHTFRDRSPVRLILISVVLLLAVPASRSQVPHILSVQGLLNRSGGDPVSDGPHAVRFRLFNGPEGEQTATDEPHTVSGNTFRLDNTPIVAGSEVVRKADGTVTYTRNTAYTINNSTGVVTRVSAAAIPDGTALVVSYRWTPTVYWSENQTVQTSRGLFAALLGVSHAVPTNALTGNDWLEISVADGGSIEVLAPRKRLVAAPYALRTASLDGASGGSVTGSIRASGQVSGQGASVSASPLSLISPGIVGTGATSAAGDAPGVRAVGANNTGLALDVVGDVNITGSVVTDATISTRSLNASGVVLGNAIATSFGSTAGITGNGVSNLNGSAPGVRARSAITGGLALEAVGDISATDDIRASGDITASGFVAGKGLLRPDYDSGLLTIAENVQSRTVELPSSLGSEIGSWLVVVTYETTGQDLSGSYHTIWPGHMYLRWVYTRSLNTLGSTTNRDILVVREPSAGTKAVQFRVRIWIPHN